ncbi:MAG: hypothetical protein FD152_3258 [Xanthobacteraceae bacterium]|nr:MAG: hypothetical protein FD152_3258 [Xanthobacteraceae bacterium]
MFSSKFTSAASWSELLLHVENLFFFFFAPFLLQIVLIAILLIISRRILPIAHDLITPISLTFAIAGIVVGYFVGASRQPVVAALLPAILTLIGAIAAYAFGKDSLVELRPVVGYALAALMLGALSGTVHGQSVRAVALAAEEIRNQQKEAMNRRYEEWRLNYERVELPLRLETLRKQLGLPIVQTPPTPRPPS